MCTLIAGEGNEDKRYYTTGNNEGKTSLTEQFFLHLKYVAYSVSQFV